MCIALLLRALLIRPDPLVSSLRLQLADVPHGRHELTALFWAVAVGMAAAVSAAPPIYIFWQANALAIHASESDRWLMGLLTSAAAGLRILLHAARALLPRSSTMRRRWLSLAFLSSELVAVQNVYYPLVLWLVSPLMLFSGFTAGGTLHSYGRLSLITFPPRSALVLLLPSLLAADAHAASLADERAAAADAHATDAAGGAAADDDEADDTLLSHAWLSGIERHARAAANLNEFAWLHSSDGDAAPLLSMPPDFGSDAAAAAEVPPPPLSAGLRLRRSLFGTTTTATAPPLQASERLRQQLSRASRAFQRPTGSGVGTSTQLPSPPPLLSSFRGGAPIERACDRGVRRFAARGAARLGRVCSPRRRGRAGERLTW